MTLSLTNAAYRRKNGFRTSEQTRDGRRDTKRMPASIDMPAGWDAPQFASARRDLVAGDER